MKVFLCGGGAGIQTIEAYKRFKNGAILKQNEEKKSGLLIKVNGNFNKNLWRNWHA